MSERKTMQMALEALNLPSLKTQQMLLQRDEAIATLRAALEQPEQEPVAWMSQAGNFLSPLEFTTADAALYGWTPVYTTTPAPQRKPLTDDEIRNAIRLYKADENLMGVNHVHVARAVEAAHGIKEQP